MSHGRSHLRVPDGASPARAAGAIDGQGLSLLLVDARWRLAGAALAAAAIWLAVAWATR